MKLARWWQRLTQPPNHITQTKKRRQIRLLLGLLIVIFVVGFIATSLQLLQRPNYLPTFIVVNLGLLSLLAAYGLARMGHYQAAALITVGSSVCVCFAIIIFDPTRGAAYAYFGLSLVLASLLLDEKGLLIDTAIILLGISLGLPAIGVPYPNNDAFQAPTFVLMLAGLLFLFRRCLHALEQDHQATLAASEAQFRALFEQAAIGVAQIDSRSGRFLRVNQRYCDITGYTAEEMCTLSFQAISHPDEIADNLSKMHQLIAGEIREYSLEKRYYRKDGGTVWVMLTVSPMWKPGEAPSTHIAVVQDITVRKRAEEQMSQLSSALEQTADSVLITDKRGIIEYANPAFAQITGYTQAEIIGQNPRLVKSGRHDAAYYQRLWQTILAGEVYRAVMINRRKDGSDYYEEKTITPLKDATGRITHFVSTGKDVTDRMQTQHQLAYMAQHDALTELPNRTLLLDRLNQAIARARWHRRIVAVLFVDLDRFKTINDTLGHEIGDLLLQQLAARFSACVREGDTVARFGGDEFVILLDDVANEGDIRNLANKVLAAMAPSFDIAQQQLYITASIGISLYPNDGEDATTLLKHADVAMYRAKELGKNTYQFYSADMSARAFERLTLESSLRHALERGELRLHYQPVIDLRNGSISSVEALLRWQHPDFGLVMPNDFISVLEDTGLIVPAGEWVLVTACAQLDAWHQQGWPGLRLAVNLSPRQFQGGDLIRVLQRALALLHCPPSQLELEITESMLMQEGGASLQRLEGLHDLGVRLAIDDFGTGYSSLSYLRRFPVDTLKIDRSFVRDLPGDPDDSAITTAITVLAQSLKLQVIAEGVENEAQRDFLSQLGCYLMQGHLFITPLPAEALTPLLAKHNPRT